MAEKSAKELGQMFVEDMCKTLKQNVADERHRQQEPDEDSSMNGVCC